jgi:lipopolysaccharide export system protein LptA
VAASLWAAGPGPARAERADRNKPMVVEADREGTIDTQRGVTTFSGNALISQGTMLIRAERVEVRDPPGGARSALALGTVAQPATYRQKRDGVDEHMEAQAERIEYDAASETLRFTGQAALRRLRAGSVGIAAERDASGKISSCRGGNQRRALCAARAWRRLHRVSCAAG